MELQFVYVKKRGKFGIQPLYSHHGPMMLDSIPPIVEEQKKYILRNPIHNGCQVSKDFAAHEVNTIRVVMKNAGINHVEGGWPREVNFLDEEANARYKRKWEKEDEYVEAVLKLAPRLTNVIRQNNAIDHYQQYYADVEPFQTPETYNITSLNIFFDPLQAMKRPVSSIIWNHDEKIVAAYCDKTYIKRDLVSDRTRAPCYIWDVENSKEPYDTFEPEVGVWILEPSPRDSMEYVAGYADGRVSWFDLRASHSHVAVCPAHVAHRDPVAALLFIHSRSLTEFFSGSSDGQCMWWDYRNLSEPYETMTMTTQLVPGVEPTISNAQGVTSLHYERALPTRFLVGTETGWVVNVNRKGKTLSETMASQWYAQVGPVKALQRNPTILKMFITCGNYRMKIWSEDCKHDCVVAMTPYTSQIVDAKWAPNRCSSFFALADDGFLQYWDVLRTYKAPLFQRSATPTRPTKMAVQNEGRMIAVGDRDGNVSLKGVTQSMQYSEANDKSLLLHQFERETRREQILEGRLKEIRLKQKQDAEKVEEEPTESVVDEEAILKEAQEDYFDQVETNFRKYTPSYKIDRKRNF